MHILDRTNTRLLSYTLLLMLYAAMVFWASPNLRGSDQYWYVGDVERAMLGDGIYKTNSIFPLSLPDNPDGLPRPWVQNKPVCYLVLPLVSLLQNGHYAWVIFNILCVFGAALLTSKCLDLSARNRFWFVSLFVFFPFNFYLVSQALPEIFVMLLISALLYLVAKKPATIVYGCIVGLLAGLLIWQRTNYVLLIPGIPIVWYWSQRKSALKGIMIYIVITSAMVLAASTLFSQHLVKYPSIKDTILLNQHGQSNMGPFFDDYDNSSVGVLELVSVVIKKVWGALVVQFKFAGLSNTLMFYLVTLLFPGLIWILTRRDTDSRLRVMMGLLTLIHLATIVLFYNQYRYAAAVMPALFLANFYLLRKATFGRQLKLKLGLTGLAMAISMVMGWQLRSQSLQEQARINQMKNATRLGKAFLCHYKAGAGLAFGYAVSPSLVYYYEDSSPDKLREAIRLTGATHAAVFKGTRDYDKWKSQNLKEIFLSAEMVLFELKSDEQ
jgi:hypothetical protein